MSSAIDLYQLAQECTGAERGLVRWTAMLTPHPAPSRGQHDEAERRAVCKWDLYTRGKSKEWFADYLPGGCGEVGLKVRASHSIRFRTRRVGWWRGVTAR
jgi:5-methylcytosine-specific restriction endonuclease McrA